MVIALKDLILGVGKKNQKTDNNSALSLPRAVAFVDYEHWYISLNKNFGLKPNIKGWFEDLSKRVTIVEAVFFADFSHKSLADEIKRIRPYSNKIIDTRSPSGTVKKDFTDFIILDNIYQKALSSNDIDAFILFSGDGHFSSVTSFLKNFYMKEVGIYAIKDSFSRQLQETASWHVVLPTEEDVYGTCYQLIFDFLREAQDKKTKVLPTLPRTVEAVCKKSKLDRSRVEAAVKKLIADKIIFPRKIRSSSGGNPNAEILFVNWEAAERLLR